MYNVNVTKIFKYIIKNVNINLIQIIKYQISKKLIPTFNTNFLTAQLLLCIFYLATEI